MAEATGVEPLVVFHGVQGGYSYLARKGGSLDLTGLRLPTILPARGIHAVADHRLPVRRPTHHRRLAVSLSTSGRVPYGYLAVIAASCRSQSWEHELPPGSPALGRVSTPLSSFSEPPSCSSKRAASPTCRCSSARPGSSIPSSSSASSPRSGRPTSSSVADSAIPLAWVFGLLVISLLVNYLVRPSALLNLPLVARGLLGGLLNALPVASAGLLFSSLLRRSAHPDAALGSNLLGAVVGGCLEYLSMMTGLRALTLLALALYSVAALLLVRGGPGQPSRSSGTSRPPAGTPRGTESPRRAPAGTPPRRRASWDRAGSGRAGSARRQGGGHHGGGVAGECRWRGRAAP